MEVTAFTICLAVATFISTSAEAAPIAETTDPGGIATAIATPGLLVTKVVMIKSAVLIYGVWNSLKFPRRRSAFVKK